MKSFKRLPCHIKTLIYPNWFWLDDNKAGQRYLNSITFYKDLIESLYQAHEWAKGNCLANVRVSVRKIEE